MKKIYYNVGQELQINLFDERWYNTENGLYPAVTFILNIDIGFGLISWIKEHGIYADKIRDIKAEIGSLLHNMIEILLKTGKIYYKYFEHEEYFIRAWRRMTNFITFYEKELKEHKIIAIETTTINDEYRYAGTIDLITIDRDGNKHVWDWKSSDNIQEHHKTQIAAYARSEKSEHAHIVLFPEYPRTKQGYSKTDLDADKINNYFNEFLFIKSKFDRITKEPLYKTIPIIYEV